MPLPRLYPLHRLWPFLSLGIATTLLVLGLNIIPLPSTATIPTRSIAQTSSSARSTLDLVQQGKTAYQKGQLNQAITLWQQAVTAFASQGDRLHQAMALSYLAQAYQQLGAWDKANPAIAESLELLKQPNQRIGGDRLHILAEAQTIQGSLQLDQGQADAAFASWQQAASTFQQAGEPAGVIRSQINQSQALVTLGLYQRANKLLESLYQKLPPEEPLQLAILLNYGETLRLVGQLSAEVQPQAKSSEPIPKNYSPIVLRKGLALAQKLNSPADITAAQLSLGNTYRALNQLQKRLQTSPCNDPTTLKYYQEAKQFYQQAAEQATSPTSKIQALLNQQNLLFLHPSDPHVIDTAPVAASVQAITAKIQPQLDRLPLNHPALYARIQLADNLLKINDSQQAIPLLETTVKQAESLGDRAAQSYALGYLGQAYEQQRGGDDQKNTSQALALTKQALDLAKTLNAPEIAYRWFWQLGRLDRANNPERAIQNYRAAHQKLQNFRLNLAKTNPDLQFSFREQTIDPVYREFVDILLHPQPMVSKAPQSEPTEKSLQEARQVIQDLQNTELTNFLQEPCASSNIEEIDNLVKESNSFTAMLSHILLPDRIEVIAKLPGQHLYHYSSPILSNMSEKISQFQRDLQESYTFDDVKHEGQEIYQWLIPEPLQKQLEEAQIKTIVFSLDGPLRNIPMAALHSGKEYLIEKYAVAVTLDLEMKAPKAIPNNRLRVLAASLANPPKQPEDKFKYAKLTYVDAELDAIQNTASVTAIPIRDSKFTLDLFNKRFNNAPFEIVHLATHGQFSSNPQDTFILTAASKLRPDGKVRLSDFDEMFRTRELNRADAIELLILSACETASGDDRATLGIAGAAVKAGARSAIASLWSLDDQSSQVFMTAFYNAITQPHTSRAKALQTAQLALLKQDGYAHPRYWAPFLLVGNWL
jgi:CHAT domain-containing protein